MVAFFRFESDESKGMGLLRWFIRVKRAREPSLQGSRREVCVLNDKRSKAKSCFGVTIFGGPCLLSRSPSRNLPLQDWPHVSLFSFQRETWCLSRGAAPLQARVAEVSVCSTVHKRSTHERQADLFEWLLGTNEQFAHQPVSLLGSAPLRAYELYTIFALSIQAHEG